MLKAIIYPYYDGWFSPLDETAVKGDDKETYLTNAGYPFGHSYKYKHLCAKPVLLCNPKQYQTEYSTDLLKQANFSQLAKRTSSLGEDWGGGDCLDLSKNLPTHWYHHVWEILLRKVLCLYHHSLPDSRRRILSSRGSRVGSFAHDRDYRLM